MSESPLCLIASKGKVALFRRRKSYVFKSGPHKVSQDRGLWV